MLIVSNDYSIIDKAFIHLITKNMMLQKLIYIRHLHGYVFYMQENS